MSQVRTIGEKRFYQLSLALPIALPLALVPPMAAALWLAEQFDDSDAIGIALLPATILVAASVFAFVPYCVFAAIGLAVMRDRPASAWRRFLRWAPPSFTPLLWAFWLAVEAVLERDDRTWTLEALGAAAILGVLAVAFGYLYVAIAFGLRRSLLARGRILPEPDPA